MSSEKHSTNHTQAHCMVDKLFKLCKIKLTSFQQFYLLKLDKNIFLNTKVLFNKIVSFNLGSFRFNCNSFGHSPCFKLMKAAIIPCLQFLISVTSFDGLLHNCTSHNQRCGMVQSPVRHRVFQQPLLTQGSTIFSRHFMQDCDKLGALMKAISEFSKLPYLHNHNYLTNSVQNPMQCPWIDTQTL